MFESSVSCCVSWVKTRSLGSAVAKGDTACYYKSVRGEKIIIILITVIKVSMADKRRE